MTLDAYLKTFKVKPSDLAREVGVSFEAMRRYRVGQRMPTPPIMARILEATKGNVTPNDFFSVIQRRAG